MIDISLVAGFRPGFFDFVSEAAVAFGMVAVLLYAVVMLVIEKVFKR